VTRLVRQRLARGVKGYRLPRKFARCIRPILLSSRVLGVRSQKSVIEDQKSAAARL